MSSRSHIRRAVLVGLVFGCLCFGVMSCATSKSALSGQPSLTPHSHGIQLQLPRGYAHWAPFLHEELGRTHASWLKKSARWMSASSESDSPLRLVVFSDSRQCAAFLKEMGLTDDPTVARTYPNLALAVVPLPRDDELIKSRPRPPTTWLATLLHEAAHLWSVSVPRLRSAPLWFQEGYAEAWAWENSNESDHWPWLKSCWRSELPPLAKDHLLSSLGSFPSEVRLSAWRDMALLSMLGDSTTEPWKYAEQWTPQELASHFSHLPKQPSSALKGRDADIGLAEGLLATPLGEMVALRAPETWDATQLWGGVFRLGRSGNGEAGLLIRAASSTPQTVGQQVRIRWNTFGQMVAYLERNKMKAERMKPMSSDFSLGGQYKLSLLPQGSGFWVRCGDYQKFFSHTGDFSPPFELEIYVRDGVLEYKWPIMRPQTQTKP